MRNRWIAGYVFFVLAVFLISGCATARPRHAEKQAPATGGDQQIAALQSELQAKDQQIQDLQYQLEQTYSRNQGNYTPGNSYRSGDSGKSNLIRVKGVSVTDVQRALDRAGFDPGRIDGKMGKKTKAAVKAFQRTYGLKADGVVGEKTWKKLQSR